jgi:hypothetical protein
MYGSDIWGAINPFAAKVRNNRIFKLAKAYDGNHVDKLNLKFCKYILQVHRMASKNAVLGELGRYPMYTGIAKNMVAYWHRLELSNDNSLVRNAMVESKGLHRAGHNSWFSSIKFILDESGLEHFVKSFNFRASDGK